MHHFLNIAKYLTSQWAWIPFVIYKSKRWTFLIASPRFRQVADDCVLTVSPRSPPWSLPWCISAMELHCQWPTASSPHDSALTQQPLNTVRISTWGEGLGRPPCAGLSWCPTQKASQASALWSWPPSALGSPGNLRRKTKTLASNSRALLLCVVFTDLLGIFLTLWFNQNYMKQFVQRKIIGVGRW